MGKVNKQNGQQSILSNQSGSEDFPVPNISIGGIADSSSSRSETRQHPVIVCVVIGDEIVSSATKLCPC